MDDIAFARKLYLHLSAGGVIVARDMGILIEGMEAAAAGASRLRAALAAHQLGAGTTIWRQQRALAPLLTHADAGEVAPPIRFSVRECGRIRRGLEEV